MTLIPWDLIKQDFPDLDEETTGYFSFPPSLYLPSCSTPVPRPITMCSPFHSPLPSFTHFTSPFSACLMFPSFSRSTSEKTSVVLLS